MSNSPLAEKFESFWRQALSQNNPSLRRWLTALTCGLLAVIGLADFLLGIEVSLLVFYFIPIAVAVVARGPRFAVLVALVCVVTWLVGDVAAGARYPAAVVPLWNAAIAFITYLVLIWLLAGLLALHRDLEERVERRTAALAAEVAERERLEKVVLEISERERRSIGHDLHDGLGQHLTGTALTGQLLVEKLQERSIAEVNDAKKIVGLVKSAIAQTRQMAKGLLLADIDGEGLSGALQEFCASTSEQYRVECIFRGPGGVSFLGAGVASQLFRIAQEAVRNGIRHGQARRIDVQLEDTAGEVMLSVRDNGTGIPRPGPARGEGLGLRIMMHRATIIGAFFSIEAVPEGGTVVRCTLPPGNPT